MAGNAAFGPIAQRIVQQVTLAQMLSEAGRTVLAAMRQGRMAALNARPARDLTADEALELLLLLNAAGEVTLVTPPRWDPKHPDKLLSPRPGDQPAIKNVIAGVTFAHASDATRPKGGAEGSDGTNTLRPTPAFAVVLHRLAKMLAAKWQVTSVVWGGIGAGRATTDCHSNGRCVDFYGVVRSGGQTIDVLRDWYSRPVYTALLDDAGDQEKIDDPPVGGDNWGNRRDTYYRLVYSPEPQDQTPGQLFADVYQLAAEQCTVGSNDLSGEYFRRGLALQQGYIFHPDYPKAGSFARGDAGRRSHHDHMHFQIGAT